MTLQKRKDERYSPNIMCSHEPLPMQSLMMQESSAEMYEMQHEIRPSRGSRQVHIHPLVTFNVADHYTRVCRQHSTSLAAPKTTYVIGALFGTQKGLEVSILDSFELKYEVSEHREVHIDKDFLAGRLNQFSQVFPNYELLGWYSVGPNDLEMDISIHKTMMEFNESPLFLVMDPSIQSENAKRKLPVYLYESELHVLHGAPKTLFVQIAFKIETSETEGIAIDHISKVAPTSDSNKSSVHPHLGNIRDAIMMLSRQIQVLVQYLDDIQSNDAIVDYGLLHQISTICNQLPTLGSDFFEFASIKDHIDAKCITYLAALTKGAQLINTVTERFSSISSRDTNGC
uniref:COP9 signalosome complex subunit 6 n=1 Tax=Albugo laibachii Nc14 TaxID=890382 RepID=F0WUJ5_9STRA|nr:COP9 signalosome complex subunit putative [Albugo laibachii Nc14]|eukprot:CCA25076.1 COP9 signalosome complex subunit putative [Albugo laibachii Nc14]